VSGDGWDDPIALPEEEGQVPPAAPAAPPAAPGSRRTLFLGGGALAAIAVAVVAVLVLAGGGSSKTKQTHAVATRVHQSVRTTPGAAALSQDQFVRQANDICSTDFPTLDSDMAQDDATAIESDIEQVAGELQALGPPTADAATMRSAIGSLESAVNALHAGNFPGMQAAIASFNSLVGQIGLTVCAAH
jgi:uncharacterized protein HemX